MKQLYNRKIANNLPNRHLSMLEDGDRGWPSYCLCSICNPNESRYEGFQKLMGEGTPKGVLFHLCIYGCKNKKTCLYQRRICISQCLRMWIEVDRVVVSDQSVIPTRLDVRNLERVADRLDVARRDAALRTEKTRDASLQ